MNDIPNGGHGFDTPHSKWIASLRDGEPCDHRGCLSHISHPCEGCGRVGGRRTEEPNHGNNPLLTQEEVNQLPDGTEVFIEWAGGNSGRYVVLHDKYGHPNAYYDTKWSKRRVHVSLLLDVSTNPLLTNVSLAQPGPGNNREAASTLKTGVVSLSGIETPPLCFTNETEATP